MLTVITGEQYNCFVPLLLRTSLQNHILRSEVVCSFLFLSICLLSLTNSTVLKTDFHEILRSRLQSKEQSVIFFGGNLDQHL